MPQFVTTHNSRGKAVFSNKVPSDPHDIAIQGDAKKGSIQFIYNVDTFKPDLSTEDDVDAFQKVRTEGLPPGTICPPNGAGANIVTIAPGSASLWHRTMTLDFIYVIEGIVELHLDGGESKTLTAGDTVVQRGTMHAWKNVTPNDGIVRLVGFAMPIQEPLTAGGQKLETEWRM